MLATSAISSASRDSLAVLTQNTSSAQVTSSVVSGAVSTSEPPTTVVVTNSSSSSLAGGLLSEEDMAQQMAAAQQRFAALEQQRLRIQQQGELQRLLDQCRLLEEENNRSLSIRTTPYPTVNQQQQQTQQPQLQQPQSQQQILQQHPPQPQHNHNPTTPSVSMAAAGLMRLGTQTNLVSSSGMPFTPVGAYGQAPVANNVLQPPQQITSASLRQMSGIQAGVEDHLRRYGLQRNDPALSERDDASQVGDIRGPSSRTPVKSGKLVHITSRVVQAEKWPHSYLGRQYVGANKQFEDLSLAEFCAGYAAILLEEERCGDYAISIVTP